MKQFRITYKMEITIDAESEEQAQEIFNNEIDVYDLSIELRAEYVEQVSIEELQIMGSVIDYIECPRCKQDDCVSDFYYKTGEEYVSCGDCGYYYSFVIKRDSEGKMIKIDETKELSANNVITKETIIDNPYGSFIIEFNDGMRNCGTLETKEDYDKFVSDIASFTNQEHDIKQAVVSSLIDGKIIKETIFKTN